MRPSTIASRALIVLIGLTSLLPTTAASQGCAPSRFASPMVGPLGDVYMNHRTWEVGVAYRRLNSNQYIVGREVRNDLAAFGQPSVVKSQAVFASVAYAVTDRLSVALSVPFLHGVHETTYADTNRHRNTATGVGDMSVSASYWLRSAQSLQPGGNLAVGFGVKAPTGKNDVSGQSWKANGDSVAFPVHQSIQLGDGGWGFIANMRAFKPIGERTYAHAGGSYTFNPKKQSDVTRSPTSPVRWDIPDTWDAEMGVSTLVWMQRGVSVNFGAMFHGTPRRDLIGRADAGLRLPATSGYLNPGVTLFHGAHTFGVGVPVRMYMNFQTNAVDAAAGKLTGGGLSRAMILTTYSVRF